MAVKLVRKVFNLRAYLAAEKHMYEVDAQKAMILSALNHDKWKAGGAL